MSFFDFQKPTKINNVLVNFCWLLADTYNFDDVGAIEIQDENDNIQVLTNSISDLFVSFFDETGSKILHCLKLPGIFPDY